MAEEQDKSHRLLFHFPRMIQDLIRLYLGGGWVDRLDFETLERVPERLLSKELIRREQDVLWRLKYHPHGQRVAVDREPVRHPSAFYDDGDIELFELEDEYFYVYLHIEHQSRPRVRMALDMVTYKLLALQDLTREGFRLGDPLPPVFQVVFYNGEQPWNVPTSLLDILRPVEDGPEGLDFWSYKLIDAQRVDLESLVGKESPLLGLLRLEQLDNLETLEAAIADLRTVLGPEDENLAEAFLTFINEIVLSKIDSESQPRWQLDDLQENETVVAQRVERIVQNLRLEGRQEGLKAGRQEGRKVGRQEGRREGELAVLHRQLERKFGELPPETIETLERANVDRLLKLSDRVLTATKLEDVF